MRVLVEIVEGPLTPVKLQVGEGTGAFVVFEGVVRGEEDGRKLEALEYQVYEPMASKQLESLANEMVEEFGVLDVAVWHSSGIVKAGEVSFRLVIEGVHRHESLEAVGEFIERMKRDVPIWKQPIFAPTKPGGRRSRSNFEKHDGPKKPVRTTAKKSKRKPKQ
ncbi:MAG: molybdenum cofactor biosynthesis protein MoaE [Phycisphaerales bacterium]|nr:molybdenum cofactor biosynthesis protein MoaE [Phycisphaerales bacterium]